MSQNVCKKCQGRGFYQDMDFSRRLIRVVCEECRPQINRTFIEDLASLCALAEDLASRAEGIGTLACLCRLLMALSREIKGSYLRNLEERQ